jgi:hypothetical protein
MTLFAARNQSLAMMFIGIDFLCVISVLQSVTNGGRTQVMRRSR